MRRRRGAPPPPPPLPPVFPRPLLLLLLLLAAPTIATTTTTTTTTTTATQPYPLGTCTTECFRPPPAPCPGQVCDAAPETAATCPALYYPTAQSVRERTYCVADFRARCDAQPGCGACALWQAITRHCGPEHDAAERCEYRPGAATGRRRAAAAPVAVLPSRERDPQTGLLCFTARQFMVLPLRACTGVEDPDVRCSGGGNAEAEGYWATAWREALRKGFPPADGGGGSAAAAEASSAPTWAVVLSPTHMRSQHQAHFRFAPFIPDQRSEQQSPALRTFLTQMSDASFRVSADRRRPTLSPGDDPEGDNSLLASVFVPCPPRRRRRGHGGGCSLSRSPRSCGPLRRPRARRRRRGPGGLGA